MSSRMNPVKNFGWFAVIALVILLLYPLSLNVAALRGDLMKVDKEVLSVQKEINYLQAELKARANLQQLEEWNELLYGFKSPTVAQFSNGEKALASLGRSPIKVRPVLVAANNFGTGEAPKGVIGSPFAPLKAAEPKKAKKITSKKESVTSKGGTEDESQARPSSIDELLNNIDNVKVAQGDNGDNNELERP